MKKFICSELVICTFLFILIVYSLPFFVEGYPHGNDLFYHFSRIQGSIDVLKEGVMDLSILPGFLYDFGYAITLFYPTGLLWIPILLVKSGVDFIISYKVFIFFITGLTMLTMGFSTFRYFKRWDVSLVAVVFYIFNVYRNYSDLLELAALGEFIAFAFIPLAIFGLHAIYEKDRQGRWMLILGMLGLILSHLISTILTIIILMMYAIYRIKDLSKDVVK